MSRFVLRRILAVSVSRAPPRANGASTMPWLLLPALPPSLHGRGAGGVVLLCPGGPETSPGHGGRACFGLPSTGASVGVARGVGRGVGLAVGFAVGFAVGLGVGAAVGSGVGRRTGGCVGFGGVAVGPAGVGTGVGPAATIGPSDGDADGSDEGTDEGTVDPAGSADEPPGSLDVGPVVGLGELVLADPDGAIVGLALAAATPPGGDEGADGATMPAVRATVATREPSAIGASRSAPPPVAVSADTAATAEERNGPGCTARPSSSAIVSTKLFNVTGSLPTMRYVRPSISGTSPQSLIPSATSDTKANSRRFWPDPGNRNRPPDTASNSPSQFRDRGPYVLPTLAMTTGRPRCSQRDNSVRSASSFDRR